MENECEDKKGFMKIEPEKISLTFYLMATGKKKRRKMTIWIEEIYYKKLKEDKQVIISDVVNYLLEMYLRATGKLDVMEIIKELSG